MESKTESEYFTTAVIWIFLLGRLNFADASDDMRRLPRV
jgi:hypothetical protein